MKRIYLVLMLPVLILMLAMAGCGGSEQEADGGSQLTGTIRVDGSSTVFPVTEAVGEEFQRAHPKTRVTVGISGTGGGFKKFCAGETDINDASRPIKDKESLKAAENSIEYVEIPVAYDGLSVIVNPANDWVDHMTVEELHRVWQPGSTVKTWRDIRPEWPDEEIALYGPDVDSGTFDYFTEVVNGKSQVCRPDYTASADDNVLVTGVAGDKYSLGYFGYAYYVENAAKLKLVPIDGGKGPVSPSQETINNGSYAPLSRPIFIYVASASGQRPEIKSFVEFYLKHGGELAEEVGYVALPDRAYELGLKRFAGNNTGSVFNSKHAKAGMSLVDLLGQ